MKRSEFLKKLGIGLGVAVVAPTLLAENTGKEEIKPLVLPKPTGNPNRPLTTEGIIPYLRRKGEEQKKGWVVNEVGSGVDLTTPEIWEKLHERYGNMNIIEFNNSVFPH